MTGAMTAPVCLCAERSPMQYVRSHGPLRFSSSSIAYILKGVPLFLLLAWATKAFTPDLAAKSALLARDLELRLEIVSTSRSLFKQLVLPFITGMCLLWIIQARKHMNSFLSILIPMMIFGGFLLVSVVWSDHPDDTLRRAIRQVILFAAVAGVVVVGRSQDRFVNHLQFFSVSLLIYEMLFLLIPHISFDIYGNFTGLHPAKNEFGGVAGAFLLIAVCVYRYYAETPKEKKIALLCVLGWAGLLIISGSKTPMGFVVLLIPLVFMSIHLLRLASITVIVIWLFILVIIPMFLIGVGEAPIDFYRSILPEEALTGRTGIWFHLLSDIQKNVMWGTGYGAYWGVGAIPEALDIKWSYYQFLQTAHSGFIDLVLSIGLIPTVFWMLGLWMFLTFTRNSADPISIAMIAYAMLHNCLETSFAHGVHFVWVLMLLGMMNILYTHAHKPSFRRGFNETSIPGRDPVADSNAYAGAVRNG